MEWQRTTGQQPLSGAEIFLDSIIENLPNMVFVKDAEELRFIRLNKAGEDLLGIPRDELLGKNDYDFFPETEAHFFTQKDREVLAGKQLVDIPTEPIQTRHLGTRILHTKKIPIVDTEGTARYLLGISEDVTERVETERSLQQARDDAEAANKAKSEFLARMSHELRTPLNAILGFAQLLQLDASFTQNESIEHIVRAGRHLLQLINEVLDITQIETGRLTMSLEPVDVNHTINEALDIVRPLATTMHVTFIESASPHANPPIAFADRNRLRQILVNLLANAVKYNKYGGTVAITASTTTTDLITVDVSDTGIGIDPNYIPEMFTPFNRLGVKDSKVEGTGLGLALCKLLVETMNGSISVESTKGTGSRFTISIPQARNSVEPLKRIDVQKRSLNVSEDLPITMLYIEDNTSNVQLMRAACSLWNDIKLEVRENGLDGLQAVFDINPDLILLDLHLPDISGEEVLRRIKSTSKIAHIPVVVLTANAMPGAMRATINRGAAAYVTKPFDIDQLFEVIKKHALSSKDSD